MSIRFGLGNPAGMRSNSWHIRTGNDGSIYIAPRLLKKSHRGTVKVSLHPRRPDGTGGRWKMAFEEKYVQQRPDLFRDGAAETVIAEWDSESVRLGPNVPIREGFAVVLGRFSLGPDIANENPDIAAEEAKHLAKVDWERDLPDPEHAYQWTILVGDPGVPIAPPGTRSMAAAVVGVLNLGPTGLAYVMRHDIPVTDTMLASMKEHGEKGASKLNPDIEKPGVVRATLHGQEPSGLQWAMELAMTHGFAQDEIERMLERDIVDSQLT